MPENSDYINGDLNASLEENEQSKMSRSLEVNVKGTNAPYGESYSCSLVSPTLNSNTNAKKRSFNVDSLLAPDLISGKRLKTSMDEQHATELKIYEANQSHSHEFKLESQTKDLMNVCLFPNGIQSNSDDAECNNENTAKTLYKSSSFKNFSSATNLHSSVDTKSNHNSNKNSTSSTLPKQTINNHHHHLHQNQVVKMNHANNNDHHHHHHQNSPFSKLESNNADVENWKLTFSKIMARSYKNNSSNANQLINNSNNLTNKKS